MLDKTIMAALELIGGAGLFLGVGGTITIILTDEDLGAWPLWVGGAAITLALLLGLIRDLDKNLTRLREDLEEHASLTDHT